MLRVEHRLPVLYPNNSAPAPSICEFRTLATLNAPGHEAVLASYARLGIISKSRHCPQSKPVVWIGTTKADLTSFPEDVKDAIGYALYIAQGGGKHADAKPLRGFSGAGILEIVEDHAGDTYRAVYTVRLAGRIYVLHVFQKKSKTGIETPKPEIELIKSRLKRAEEEHARWLEGQKE